MLVTAAMTSPTHLSVPSTLVHVAELPMLNPASKTMAGVLPSKTRLAEACTARVDSMDTFMGGEEVENGGG
jgi:hypothetical protein